MTLAACGLLGLFAQMKIEVTKVFVLYTAKHKKSPAGLIQRGLKSAVSLSNYAAIY